MEYIDVCDENGVPTGRVVSRETAHREGLRHRTAHVFIVRETGEGFDVLLQKRCMQKESFPGLYDTSSAGHIPAGVEPVPSALREMDEELGICAEPSDLIYAGMFRVMQEDIFHGKLFRNSEVIFIYVYRKPVAIEQLTLQESEVEEVRWFNLEEVYEAVKSGAEGFCVTASGLKLLKEFLYKKEKIV